MRKFYFLAQNLMQKTLFVAKSKKPVPYYEGKQWHNNPTAYKTY